MINIEKILKMLPHRYPFILVDRVLDINYETSQLVALKNVTINEPFFQGHFPNKPIMPGVLIIEALAQAAALFVLSKNNIENYVNKSVYFMSIDGAKFRQVVTPGDALHLHVQKERSRGNVWKFNGEARVNGKLVAEGVLTAMISEDL